MENKAKYFITGLFAVAALCFSSCKEDDEVASDFSLDKEEITIGENGGIETVNVGGNVKWQTTTDATWVHVVPSSGVGAATCEIQIDSSVVADFRNAEIQFMAQGLAPKVLKVVQAGYAKGVFVENADQEIVIENSAEYGKRYYDLKMTANTNFSVSVTSEGNWIRYKDKVPVYEYGDRPRTFTQRFEWDVNVSETERTAQITITPDEGEAVVLNVRQKSAPKITDDRAGDSLAILAIYKSMNGMLGWNDGENMMYWDGVELWKATDGVSKEMIGRVKAVTFRLFATYESLPYQVKYLKTAKSLSFTGNANTFLKSIKLGSEICELAQYGNLKELTISAYGLSELPANFKDLGKTLELLDLSSNNFEDGLDVINKENFPHLRILRLNKINRYDTTTDLTQVADNDTIGFRWYTGFGEGFDEKLPGKTNRTFFKSLLKWDTLEELSLTMSLLQGDLPSDEEVRDIIGVDKVYTWDYISKTFGDTIPEADAKKYLLADDGSTHQAAPLVWPKMKSLSLNLSFLSGKLPKWILYHPYLVYWNPYSMIFQQEQGAINSKGEKVGFSNEPASLSNYSGAGYSESYYDMYPRRKPNYEDDGSESN